MKAVSKISKRGNEPQSTPAADKRRAESQRRRDQRQWHRLFAPPDVPHRRREARRWIDEMTVRTTNPPVSQWRPGEHLFESLAERRVVEDALYDSLRKGDPELYRAVKRLVFEDGTRTIGITLEEWRIQSARWAKRTSRVRAEMRKVGRI